MRDEKEERKKQARSNKQTRQSNTAHPRQSLFLEKNELPRVGLEPTTLHTLDRALYQLSYRGSSAGWAQISHLIVHLMKRLTMHQLSIKEEAGIMKPPMTYTYRRQLPCTELEKYRVQKLSLGNMIL